MKDSYQNNKDEINKVVNNMSNVSSGSKTEESYSRFLFDTLRTAVLYLDQWGRIRSANTMAKQLFDTYHLPGKTSLEILGCWENPIHVHQEVLSVARTGHSVIGLVEKVVINDQERWFQTDKIAVENAEHGFNGVVFTLDDITPLKQHQLSLAKSEASYRAFIDNSQDAIWRLDLNTSLPVLSPASISGHYNEWVELIANTTVVGDCNAIFNRLYGEDLSTHFIGTDLKDMQCHTSLFNIDVFVRNNFQLYDDPAIYKTAAGELRYLKVSVQGIVEGDQLVSIWGVTRDITERKRYIDRLEYQNTHDILTGLPNRTSLQSTVEQVIRMPDVGKKLAFMIIDLDSFKDVNDTLGHHVGDKIIQGIGPRITEVLRNIPSTLARLGGDEFAIVLSDIDNLQQVDDISKDLLHCIRQYFYIDDVEVEIRASIGVAVYPDQANDFSTLLRYADVAMYCAKNDLSGVAFYDPEKDAHSPKRLSLMSELGKAIRGNDLCLYYQPKISLEDQSVVGAEALARWIHPTMGFISPAEFVPIAEMTDLINDMTRWVLNESIRQISEWRGRSLDLSIAVNISARNLLQDNFCDMVRGLLSHHQVPASSLELEITESTIMTHMDKTLVVLKELNDMGIELSIDDFGTGYSSLSYLKRLPVKRLKIDYSFIINMLEDEQDQIIVNSTINMAHNLGLIVIAEGVETQALMQCLGAMECEQAQGFHIARPMPAKDFEHWCIDYSH
ncbi:MAG: diguanylate cyclase (GGDEF)-like protein [Candidatus Endobugula sp.]|jgi:diguanylate cyclase (GGDEF)-like protein